jgi:glyoxylase-like metal-dependent hydrolase (beta-lactamase superfamily II)
LVPEAHKEDEFLAESVQSYGASFGIETGPVPAIGKYLYEGMKVEFGNSSLDIFHIPGHSPGGIVFHSLDQGILIAGDVLFSGSIGRTDLPGGNYEKLITNIRNKLFVLDDNTVVYPGHGPATTIGQEKKTNPFFN